MELQLRRYILELRLVFGEQHCSTISAIVLSCTVTFEALKSHHALGKFPMCVNVLWLIMVTQFL